MKTVLMAMAVLTLASVGCHMGRGWGREKAPEQEINIYTCPVHSGMQATWKGKCPMCGMEMKEHKGMWGRRGEEGEGREGTMEGMGREGMMEGMGRMHGAMARMHMMMQAEIRNGDPSALVAMREQLQLTDKQVADLMAIADDSEKKAMAVLTDKQKEDLKNLPSGPRNMMEMHRMMMRGGMMGQGMMGGGMMGGQAPGGEAPEAAPPKEGAQPGQK